MLARLVVGLALGILLGFAQIAELREGFKIRGWKVWFNDGAGLQIFDSNTHSWKDIPEHPGFQIALVCEDSPFRRIVKGADWYWWESEYGPVAGKQTGPTGTMLPKPQGKNQLKQGFTIPDDVFESYRLAAMKDQRCSE